MSLKLDQLHLLDLKMVSQDLTQEKKTESLFPEPRYFSVNEAKVKASDGPVLCWHRGDTGANHSLSTHLI